MITLSMERVMPYTEAEPVSHGERLPNPSTFGLRFVRCDQCGQEELVPGDKPVPPCFRCRIQMRLKGVPTR